MPEPNKPSHYEIVKESSHYLRGTLKESLARPTTHFTADEASLLKPHGTYQQDDRDIRQKLLAEKKEPAYSMMVRTKFPGGKMSPDLYLACDDLCNEYANHTLRITTRQTFQFHGVLKKNIKTVIRGINEKLGTTLGGCGDNVRNVMYCPAPLHDRKKINLLPYVKAVSDQFMSKSGAYYEIWLNGEKLNDAVSAEGEDPEPIYGKTYLPRKFKFAMAFPDDNCVDIYSDDVGIVPEIQDEKIAGFNILVGGGFGMTHGIPTTYPRVASPFCFVLPEELLAITKAIVLVQRDFGNRSDRKYARMKYLIDSRGLDWFRQEVEKIFDKKTQPMHAIHWKGIDHHMGWHSEGGGRWFLGLSVENGRIKDEGKMRLKSGLRAAIEKFRPQVYLTAQQDILLSGFQENQKQELENLLTSYGVTLPDKLSEIQKNSMACPALPTCGLAIAESERALPGVIDAIEEKAAELGLAGQTLIIRMTGCPNGCARPYNAEIAFVGRTVGTYNVYVGGTLAGDRLNFLVAEKIPYAQLSKSIEPLFKLYRSERRKEEGFGDFCHRLGVQKVKEIISVFLKPAS
jgi:sulfite reductase (ferredoxin)